MIHNCDKPLMEMAAKAASYDFRWQGDDNTMIVVFDRDLQGRATRFGPWNPLEDKAQAFDLCVQIGLTVDFLMGTVYFPDGKIAAVGPLDIKRTIVRAAAHYFELGHVSNIKSLI